jgi:hypothetical protein
MKQKRKNLLKGKNNQPEKDDLPSILTQGLLMNMERWIRQVH